MSAADEPGSLLQLVRSERRLAQSVFVAQSTAATKASQKSDPGAELESDTDSDSDEVRHVVVKTAKLATTESLVRYALRHAENRRPRELHETRLLVRTEGRITNRGVTAADRRLAKTVVHDNRLEVKRCLVAAQTREPGAVVKAPSALVVEEALRHGDVTYEFTVRFEAEHSPSVSDADGKLDQAARLCLSAALRDGGWNGLPTVDVPVVAFAQASERGGGGRVNAGLAARAAALGWQHYDRGDYHQALAFFDDAYWVFHLVEYKMLSGMALEALNRPEAAADAYASYVAERRDAPDALALRGKIIRLRGSRAH